MKLTIDKKKRRDILNQLRKDKSHRNVRIDSTGRILGKKRGSDGKWRDYTIEYGCFVKELPGPDIAMIFTEE
jgi:hypothetical protein